MSILLCSLCVFANNSVSVDTEKLDGKSLSDELGKISEDTSVLSITGDINYDVVSDALKRLKSLKILKLVHAYSQKGKVKGFIASFRGGKITKKFMLSLPKTLEALSVEDKKFKPFEVSQIIPYIPYQLKELEITNLRSEEIKLMEPHLPRSLERLSLKNCEITSGSLFRLSLHMPKKLKTLDLSTSAKHIKGIDKNIWNKFSEKLDKYYQDLDKVNVSGRIEKLDDMKLSKKFFTEEKKICKVVLTS